MYGFVDTTKNQAIPTGEYPSEAMKINGQYLEDLVPGYRTLTVSGREAFLKELETQNTAARSGVLIKNRRYPARKIKVMYQICARNEEEFRTAFNRLNQALAVEDAEIIFRDEDKNGAGKYFIGTPSEASDVTPGQNAVTGEFTILCADPLKYSTEQKTATVAPGESSAVDITYSGSELAKPIIEVQFAGDCGFVSVEDTNGKKLLFGNLAEEDTDPTQQGGSETLINQTYSSTGSWSDTEQALWTFNSVPGLSNKQKGTIGSLNELQVLNRYIGPDSYGDDDIVVYGPSMMRSIPADSSGNVNPDLWSFSFRPIFAANGLLQQYGEFAALVFDADGNRIAWVRIASQSTISRQATMGFHAMGETVYTGTIDEVDGPFSKPLIAANAMITVERSADAITFRAPDIVRSFAVSDVPGANRIAFMFSRRKDVNPLSRLGLGAVQFVSWLPGDIPNSFAASDVLLVDCRTAKITLNGTSRADLGDIGNAWESFGLHPGENHLKFSYSKWVPDETAPLLLLHHREAFV